MKPTEAVSQGYSVIVSNQRAADEWTKRVLKETIHQKRQSVIAEQIHFFDNWVYKLFTRQPEFSSWRLLNENELKWTNFLFVNLYFPDSHQLAPASILSFVKGIKLLKRWNVSLDDLKFYPLTPPQEFFLKYARSVARFFEKHQLASLQDAINLVLAMNKLPIGLPKKLYWYGFDDYDPLQKLLIERLKSFSVEVLLEPDSNDTPKKISCFKFKDDHEELEHALDWLLEDVKTTRAVVLPTLSDNFTELYEKTLQKTHYNLLCNPFPVQSPSVTLTSGVPLSSLPLVGDLLDALHHPTQDQSSIYFKRCELSCKWQDKTGSVQPLHQWIAILAHALDAACWCEGFDLISEEYQARESFVSLLEALGKITGFFPPITQVLFVNLLSFCCGQSLFQPESLADKKFIMGFLEAAPLELDEIMIMQVHQEHFPQSLQPHPLIPDLLQKKLNFPHAHPSRELGYLKKIFKRYAQSSLSLSFCEHSKKHENHFPNFLMMDWSIQFHPFSGVQKNLDGSMKNFIPQKISELKKLKLDSISISAVNQYYLCPFKGLAALIKDVEPIDRMTDPLNPSLQGQLFHLFVQSAWLHKESKHLLVELANDLHEHIFQSELNRCHQRYQHLHEPMGKILSAETECEVKGQKIFNDVIVHGRADFYDRQNKLVIDLKSQNFSPTSWFSNQPDDFQGPLYALVFESEALGVIVSKTDEAKIIVKDITEYKQAWHNQLIDLIENIKGFQFDPKPIRNELCHHCHLKKGCRYDQQTD